MRHRRSVSKSGHAARWLAAASLSLAAASAALLVAVLSPSVPAPVTAAQPEARRAGTPPPRHAADAMSARASDEHRWRTVLAGLDALRARAYADLRPGLLRRVYTPGSRVLRRDRTLLLRYRRRGLRVVGLQVRVLALCGRTHRGGRAVLRVRDQLTTGTLVGATVRRPLPGDTADVRTITLRRFAGRWLISAVTPA